jgi:hypothetical protein
MARNMSDRVPVIQHAGMAAYESGSAAHKALARCQKLDADNRELATMVRELRARLAALPALRTVAFGVVWGAGFLCGFFAASAYYW